MKILFVSETCSPEKYREIDIQREVKILGAQQKLLDLLINGMVSNADIEVECLTAVPVSASCHSKRIWSKESEIITNNLKYQYLPFLNGKFSRFITLYLSTYYACKKWLQDNNNESDKIIICDPLLAHCSSAAVRAARIRKCKIVALVTDIPQYVTSIGIKNFNFMRKIFQNIYDSISCNQMQHYDAFILLTEAMNNIINPLKRPSLIIEGCVDVDMINTDNKLIDKSQPRTIVYAGGIHEKFGVGKLVRAFCAANIENAVLEIYGVGEYVNEVINISMQCPKVKYMGVVSMEEIVNKEINATLLINPRPINEEFTKYSFPSKTTEYMVSGTPLISTRLPGIPDEYSDYIYWFDSDSEEHIKNKLEDLMAKDAHELHSFGLEAKKYIIKEKNNKVQARKIIKFIDSIH